MSSSLLAAGRRGYRGSQPELLHPVPEGLPGMPSRAAARETFHVTARSASSTRPRSASACASTAARRAPAPLGAGPAEPAERERERPRRHVLPSDKSATRSITFASSRTLPGQEYA